jgi:hypothetical protein
VVSSTPPVSAAQKPQDAGAPDEDDEWLVLPQGAQPAPPAAKPDPAKAGLRPLSVRPTPVEVIAKPLPEPSERVHDPIPELSHARAASLLKRMLLMALLLVASGALIFGLLKFLNRNPVIPKPQHPRSKVVEPKPPSTPPAEPAEPVKPDPQPAAPTPPPVEPPTLLEPAPALPDGIEAKSPAMEALDVLQSFLAAKTLAERLPMMETRTPEAELAASCLAGPLPPTTSILIDMQESNPLEEFVDFYFNVDFVGNDKVANPQTLLVRSRGKEVPKVVVDPFLDLYGGRLAAYATKPSDQAGTFQVIASALASCNDPKVPDREKRLTLKLQARENAKEVAQAYFNRMSKIHEMLEDGTYSLSYANARACTVMLRWNTEDSPDYPFLEAVRITALDWNP